MIDLTQVHEVATKAALAAGDVIKANFGSHPEFELKGDVADRVTKADLEAERVVMEVLQETFPDIPVLGEENVSGHDTDTDDYRWVVDPIDGTANFTQNLPQVGTSIALQKDRQSVYGHLHYPMLGKTYHATAGEGAFCNNKSIHVADCNSIGNAVLADIFADHFHRDTAVQYPPCMSYRKYGCATLAITYVADGSVHGAGAHCMIWDIAAADLILREAGGASRWSYDEPDNERSFLTYLGCTPGILSELEAYVDSQYKKT